MRESKKKKERERNEEMKGFLINKRMNERREIK